MGSVTEIIDLRLNSVRLIGIIDFINGLESIVIMGIFPIISATD